MKKYVPGIMLLTALTATAQEYQITFTGSGAAGTVDSVRIENLSQCISLEMAGDDTLVLSPATGIATIESEDFSLQVMPNPSDGDFKVITRSSGNDEIIFTLFDQSGWKILTKKEDLSSGYAIFSLNEVPGGIFFLQGFTGKRSKTIKIISSADNHGRTDIRRYSDFSEVKTIYSNPETIVTMPFNAGDTLKLTGKSGNFRTVMMLFPVASQNVDFPFTDCTDSENNHYAVVQIGTQLWMEENLKTRKYRDGSDILNVTDSAAWANLITGAYCDFKNNPSEGEKYGRLYNFYAVSDTRGICPPGWHVPSHSEWNKFEIYLDSSVDTNAIGPRGLEIGRILKEGCETRWQYYDTTFGYNSAGFTALCANFRSAGGGWSLAPDDNHDTSYWTSTTYTSNMAWSRSLRWCYSDIYVIFPFMQAGSSVRCIKD